MEMGGIDGSDWAASSWIVGALVFPTPHKILNDDRREYDFLNVSSGTGPPE